MEETESLRKKAELILKKRPSPKSKGITEAEALRLLHELEVHQIELKMQNEELKQARDIVKTSSEKYNSLYDFAYTGYFTLSPDCKILELNLKGAGMLGLVRSSLVNTNFRQYVTLDTLFVFKEFIQKVFKSNVRETCEVRLITKANSSIHVGVYGIASEVGKKCEITVIDISKRKRTEELMEHRTVEFKLFDAHLKSSDSQMAELNKEISRLVKRLGEKEKLK